MDYIAVIPARKNSKGLKYKNRIFIKNETITRKAIKIAKKSSCKYIILTTDDEFLIKENEDISIIIKRPKILSSDNACSFDVWQHAINTFFKKNNRLNIQKYSTVLLEPTSPSRNINDILDAKKIHEKNNHNVLTVSRLKKSFTPEKIMILSDDKKNFIKFYLKKGIDFLRRQTIGEYFYRNGICYITSVNGILKKDPKKIFFKRCIPLVIDRDVANIDEVSDLNTL